ncbi:hypothetical protein, partial [Acinetobacter entericus]
ILWNKPLTIGLCNKAYLVKNLASLYVRASLLKSDLASLSLYKVERFSSSEDSNSSASFKASALLSFECFRCANLLF